MMRAQTPDTAQLLIFCRVNDNFYCTKEMLDMMSLQSTTDPNIFGAMSKAVEKIALKWDKICGVTVNGASTMTGEREGMSFMVCAKMKEQK